MDKIEILIVVFQYFCGQKRDFDCGFFIFFMDEVEILIVRFFQSFFGKISNFDCGFFPSLFVRRIWGFDCGCLIFLWGKFS